MSNIIQYFYIFTKILTSVILLLVIFIMGYALYISYKEVDTVSSNFDNKINKNTNLIFKNNTNLDTLKNQIKISNETINEIKEILINKKNNIEIDENKKKIDSIFEEVNQIKNQISKFTFTVKDSENLNLIDNHEKKIISLKETIIKKYKENIDFNKDIKILQKLSSRNNKNIFEKIDVLTINKFYGVKNLLNEFNTSSNHFIKQKFIQKNDNLIINFLSEYIDIKTKNIDSYHDQELNLLVKARKFNELGEIEKSLENLLLIDDSEVFFSYWIAQAKIYLEFEELIQGVI